MIEDRVSAAEAFPPDMLLALADALPCLVSYVDADGRYRFNNRAYAEWFGHARDEFYGRTLEDALGPPAYAAIRPHVEAALRGKRVRYEQLVPYQDGGMRWIEATYVPDIAPDGQVRGFFALVNDVSERHQLSESLKASEKRWRVLADALPFMVFQAGSDGHLSFFNSQWRQYTGLGARNLQEDRWISAVHPDDRAAIERLREAIVAGVPAEAEFRLQRADGAFRWHLSIGAPSSEPRGAMWVGALVDIDERKRAEQALRESDARVRLAQQAGKLGMFDWDIKSNTVRWDGVEQIHGVQPGAFGGTFDAYAADIYIDDRERVLAGIGRAVETGSAVDVEYRIVWPDGSVHWVHGRGQVLTSPDGVASRVTGTCQLIDERKAVEETLRRGQQTVERLMALMPVGVYACNAEGRITYFNRRAAEIWGREPAIGDEGELYCGTHRAYLPDGTYVPHEATPMAEAVRTGKAFRDLEVIAERPDGSRSYCVVNIDPMLDEQGRPAGAINVFVDITERKQAEQELRESDARVHAVLETAVDAIITIDERGTIESVNPAVERLLGYSPHELVGKNVAMIMPPPYHEEHDGYLDRYGRTGERRIIGIGREVTARRADGSTFPVDLAVSEVRLGTRRIFTGIIRDLSERVAAEDALRQSEERYRALAQVSPALIVTLTAGGEFEYISESYAEYTGLTLEEAKHWQLHGMIHQDDFGAAMEIWGHALESGEPMHNEMRLRRHDGAYRWFIVEGMPVRGADGSIVRWVTVSVDVDDRKREQDRERSLSQARELLTESLDYEDALARAMALVVPSMADWASAYVREDDGAIRRVAAKHALDSLRELSERQLPIAPDAPAGVASVIRKGAPELYAEIPERLYESFPDPQSRAAARATALRSTLIVPLRSRSGVFGALALASVTPGRFGEDDVDFATQLAHHVAIALDNARLFHDLKDSAEHLQRANAAKDEFLGLVSHELKTPITTIYGNAEVLEKRGGALDEEMRTEAISDIRQEAERLHRIIDNLLVLARLEQGQELETEPLLLRRLVGRMTSNHQRRFPDRVIDLRWESEPVAVMASPEYVEQVLQNLLSNAEKYSPVGAPITIEGGRDGDELAVRVLDGGPGIREDEAERIFDAFYRSPSTEKQAQGVGIGLAVCKRLIEAQGGRVWARPRDGAGSEFGFTLPLAPDALTHDD
jgi:PAS domain S-box-containing protein